MGNGWENVPSKEGEGKDRNDRESLHRRSVRHRRRESELRLLGGSVGERTEYRDDAWNRPTGSTSTESRKNHKGSEYQSDNRTPKVWPQLHDASRYASGRSYQTAVGLVRTPKNDERHRPASPTSCWPLDRR